MKDYILRAVDKTKTIRFFVARTTNMVQTIRDIHQSSATGSAALGRLATMASLMGANLKSEGEVLTLKMDGNGIGGRLTAISDMTGNVKVTATNPAADAPSNDEGKLNVSAFVGNQGQLAVIRDFGLKEPYTGVSELVTGEIAEDFANYFYVSEQTPTVISLGVLVDTDLSIRAAGGLFIQLMPDTSEAVISQLEKIISSLPAVSKMIDNGLSPEDILDTYFSDLKPEIVSKQEVQYLCDCSRKRFSSALVSLGRKELSDIIEEDGQAQIICDFCKEEYNFDKEELEDLVKQTLNPNRFTFEEME